MTSRLMRIGQLWVGGLAVLTVAALASCGGGYGAPAPKSTTSSPPVSGNAVTISNFSFSPGSLTVSVGTKVTWTNKDSTTHTVTSDSGAFNSGNLAPNASYSYTFSSAGTFSYHCAIHTYMTGTITVQ